MKFIAHRLLIAALSLMQTILAQTTAGTVNTVTVDTVAIDATLITDTQINLEFETWRGVHKRCYQSDEEIIYRRQIFAANYRAVIAFNQDATQTYQMAINHFSDLNSDEFAARYLTANLMAHEDIAFRGDIQDDTDALNQAISDADGAQCGLTSDTSPNTLNKGRLLFFPPPSWDWRSHGVVTAVKNQGGCGSCWAFSTTGMAEGRNRINGHPLVGFSESQLVDCCGPKGYGCYGCGGAWPIWAVNYIRGYGLLTTSVYGAYTPAQHPCKVNSPTNGFYFHIRFYVFPLAFFLRMAIRIQPISVCVDASKWYLYGSGVFNNCSSSKSYTDHAVLAVGYQSNGNWIVKNSWGTGWGQAGYITLKSGNTCGILNYALIGY